MEFYSYIIFCGYLRGLLKFDANHGNKEMIDGIKILNFKWSTIGRLVNSENVDAIAHGCR